jgi:hypothetical protein
MTKCLLQTGMFALGREDPVSLEEMSNEEGGMSNEEKTAFDFLSTFCLRHSSFPHQHRDVFDITRRGDQGVW